MTIQSIKNRVERLEASARAINPPAPGLVVIPDQDNGGFSAMGQHFESVEAAEAAFPERAASALVVVNIGDCRNTETQEMER